MAYEIQDRLSIRITFNGVEFAFARANSLEFLHMVQSTRIAVPMLHMALQDNIGFLSDTEHLGDAARIQIILAARSGGSVTYSFRLNSVQRTPNAGAFRYEIDAYLDCSTYWHSSYLEGLQGTSYKVMSQIASLTGLFFEGDNTADDQLWLPMNMNFHEWAKYITERSFRSDNSCMQMGLNFNKLLVLRDLSESLRPTVKLNFGGYKDGFLLASDVVPKMGSGSLNHFSGYSSLNVEQDTQDSGTYKKNANVAVSVRSTEGTLQVNSRVKKAVDRSRVVFSPIDVGNVHPYSEKALYQNRRLNNLYSVQVEAVTPDPTGLNLLDVVSLTLDRAQDYYKPYSGDYRVGGRVIHVQGNEYYEKLILFRKTINGTIVS